MSAKAMASCRGVFGWLVVGSGSKDHVLGAAHFDNVIYRNPRIDLQCVLQVTVAVQVLFCWVVSPTNTHRGISVIDKGTINHCYKDLQNDRQYQQLTQTC